mmetsp:Transcript_17137/g.53534  ORF Transcript_17137/g.53534 Transcript_17137/m.53534 type:complete len:222 (-) Transcript_17137:514-1179(-)
MGAPRRMTRRLGEAARAARRVVRRRFARRRLGEVGRAEGGAVETARDERDEATRVESGVARAPDDDGAVPAVECDGVMRAAGDGDESGTGRALGAESAPGDEGSVGLGEADRVRGAAGDGEEPGVAWLVGALVRVVAAPGTDGAVRPEPDRVVLAAGDVDVSRGEIRVSSLSPGGVGEEDDATGLGEGDGVQAADRDGREAGLSRRVVGEADASPHAYRPV